jgi:putative ABC transport system permease protein
MEEGCGLLVIPWIASSLDAKIGEMVEVTGVNGPVACTVAGIGSAYVGASIISESAADLFDVGAPIVLLLKPMPGINLKNLETDLRALVDSDPAVYLSTIEGMIGMISQVIEMMPKLLTALLVLAIVAAALGVINTTVMSITERGRELSLLRAVGATQRQIVGVVLGEAALMGILGGVLGLIAGIGTTFIMATVYGGNAWGVPEMDLWSAGWYAVQPALVNGLIGLVAAPFICVGAAWLPARSILSRSIIDALRIDH